ncbi:MAG: DNA translocase FtsK 4TM domain-containing protein [Hyphomicrobiaceae bacterium]
MASRKPYEFQEVPRTIGGRPLMPNAMANRLRDNIRMVCGLMLLAILALTWLSLVSWSIQDPSLSHTTSHGARNWLGLPGAMGADVIMQTFGIAALALLLGPMFWALALLKKETVPKFGRRFATYLATVMMLAAAASAWPAPSQWPLHAGLGGIAGDAVFRVVTGPFAAAHPEFGRPAAGLLLLALGLWCAIVSLGATRKRSGADKTIRHTSRSAPAASTQRVEPVLTARPVTAHVAPVTSRSAGQVTTVGPRQKDRYGPYAAFEELPNDEPADPEFEAYTQTASRMIAERFAPKPGDDAPHTLVMPAAHANVPHTMRDSLNDAFTTEGRRASHAGDPYGAPEQPAYQVLPPSTSQTVRTTALAKTPSYKRPSLNLLERSASSRVKPNYTESMLRGNARLLEDVLADFGVVGEIRDIVPGPVVTIYELEPARGTNPARVISLADDIARGMSVPSVRIAAIQGRTALAVELPNQIREPVMLRDVLDADVYRSTMDVLPVALGRNVEGRPIVADLARIPHMLVAGANGTGKSVGINAMILSLLYKHGPDECRFLMIDPKMLDLAAYNGIPHLLTPVVTDPHKAITALSWCVTEMEERYKRMAALGVRNIDVFNNRVRNAKKRGERLARTVQTGFDKTGKATYVQEEMNLEPMPYIIIVMDEFADLMAVAGNEIEGAVKRLADAAKAAGIHLIMATERPSSDIVTPGLKSSLTARISYKSASKLDSRAITGGDGAEQLLGSGDMLYANGTGQLQRVHGPYVSNEEINAVASCLREQGAPRYVEGMTGSESAVTQRTRTYVPDPATGRTSLAPASQDALYDRAVATVVRDGQASLGHLQRRLSIQPKWAAAFLQRLEADGVIGPPDAQGRHKVLVGAAA